MFLNANSDTRSGRRRSRGWALMGAAVLWIVLLVTVSHAGATHAPLARAAQDDKPTRAFFKLCADCHEPDRIRETKRTRGGWEEVIEKMIEKGATGSDQDFDLTLQYLLANYGMVNINQSPAEEIAIVIGLLPKEAEAIVAYRKEKGNFKNYDALAQMPGVDVKKLDAKKDVMLF